MVSVNLSWFLSGFLKPLLIFCTKPSGSINDENLELLTKRGYHVIDWSFDSRDSLGATPEESNRLYDELAQKFPAPQIALNHEPTNTTASIVTPHAIDVLQNAGYRFVTMSECLGYGNDLSAIYRDIGKPQKQDVSFLSLVPVLRPV